MQATQLDLPEIDWIPGPPPRLARGVELLGRDRASGYRRSPWVARLPDGRLLHLSELLYQVAAKSDGRRGYRRIADEVSADVGRVLSADDVAFLVRSKLQPAGIMTGSAGAGAPPSTGALGLRLRVGLLPQAWVNALAGSLDVFFWPPALLLALAALALFDNWLFLVHGVALPAARLLGDPAGPGLALVLVLASAGFHELGHAAACRYGGARPGRIGAGLYIVWPAFFNDVTDAYRLGRAGRIRTDLGGVYFNALFILGLACVYALSGFEPLLAVAVLLHIEAAHQFFPFLRLDGYYLVSDLVGVPDLFARIRPTLRALVPGRPLPPAVAELKRWVRGVIVVWVVLTLAILGATYVLILAALPRIAATSVQAVRGQLTTIAVAQLHGGPEPAIALLQLLAMLVPLGGLAYLLAGSALRLCRAAWTAADNRYGRAFVLFAAVCTGFLLGLQLDRHFAPIRPGERGLLTRGVFAAVTPRLGTPANGSLPELTVPAGTASPAGTVSPAAAGTGVSRATAAPGTSPTATPAAASSTPAATPAPTPAPTAAPTATPSTTTAAPTPTPSASP